MSNALSIAAVTATLRNLLDQELNADVAGTTVTTRPPDRARNGAAGNQVNLFLYHTAVNPSWRNMDVPWRVKPGESGHAPLPLNLYYLLTVYSGENEDDVDLTSDPNRLLGNHRLLGQAMRILHDHPLLTAAEINNILPADDQTDFPYDQVENVRITPQPLTLDEMSRVWTGFQTQYRLSMTYEVSVVLIESRRPRRAPLPVLRRGEQDRGVETVLGPFPVLEEIRRPPGARIGFQLGDTIELLGNNLGGETVTIHFAHPLLPSPPPLAPQPGSTTNRLEIVLPDDTAAQSEWAAGFYQVTVETGTTGAPSRFSNGLPFALSPRVTSITPNPAPRDANGDVTLSVICRPQIRPGQHVRLLLGEREVVARPLPPPPPPPAPTDTVLFDIVDAPAGLFVVRLRVDSSDSLPLRRPPGQQVYEFDPAQKVTIQ